MRILLLLCLAALWAGCGSHQPTLNVFTWSEYIDPRAIAEFEKKFGCKVVLDYHENSESMMAKLAVGGDAIYDIVVPSNRTLSILARRGLLAPLRPENIPDLTNISPQFVNPFFDPGNRYGAPYMWDTTGIYVRRSEGQAMPETWGLLFDPALQPGPFLLMDDLRACLGAALRYNGHSLNSTNRDELMQARDLLIAAKRRSLGFEGHTGSKNRVLARGAVAAMTYREVLGVKQDPETYFFVPREGSSINLDLLAIPARAPNRDLAEKFINYLLEPEVSARNATAVGSATANEAALKFISLAERADPAIYVSEETRKRLEFTRDLGADNQLYDEIWTQIKSK